MVMVCNYFYVTMKIFPNLFFERCVYNNEFI